jgi:mono/diheme cytochrome c family protein
MKTLFAVTVLVSGAALADDSGASLYQHKCATCHQLDGGGIAHAFPALAGSPTLLGDDEQLVTLVMKGRGGMPSWVYFLSDDQLGQILAYARSSWGNAAPPVDVELIKSLRKSIGGTSRLPVGN